MESTECKGKYLSSFDTDFLPLLEPRVPPEPSPSFPTATAGQSMDELLQQLGELALGAIPTLILFITLVLAYRYILYGRLMETRAEREKRTAGALEKSRQAIVQADVRSQEYEAKLRAARAEIFRRREQRIQQWNAEREAALVAARQVAQQRVQAAQDALEAQSVDARKQIEASAGQLAAQVLAAVLPAAAAESSR